MAFLGYPKGWRDDDELVLTWIFVLADPFRQVTRKRNHVRELRISGERERRPDPMAPRLLSRSVSISGEGQ